MDRAAATAYNCKDMSEKRRFLDRVYDLVHPAEARQLYDQWSDSYDADLADHGYAAPDRCAAALLAAGADPAAPLLDYGCGTGLAGKAFRNKGFSVIDGADISADMLEKAAASGIYRRLRPITPDDPLPFAPGAYTNIAAVGVFSPGHAPPETIDRVMEKLDPGGRFVFSLNDHVLADPAWMGRIMEQVDCGGAVLEFREHGDHLPELGVGATVCVLRRA